MESAQIIILAAGKGSRMRSKHPALLHRLGGRPIMEWVIDAVAPCSDKKPIAVQGPAGEIESAFGDRLDYAVQAEPLGTRDALGCAMRKTGDVKGPILVVYGNVPLIETEHYESLIEAAEQSGAAALKAADVWGNDKEEKTVFMGAWCFMDWALKEAMAFTDGSAEVEDCFTALKNRGMNVRDVMIDSVTGLNVNTMGACWECEYLLNAKNVHRLFDGGVQIMDVGTTHIESTVRIGRDTVIWPNVTITGNTVIGEDCVIKSGCVLNDTEIGDSCELLYVVSNQAKVGNNVKIGPFVNLRPDTVIADGCKIGDFVEVKNSNVGSGTKLPHLSYIGDADIGERVNVGCGCVFVNYDGFKKHRTTVGNDVFLGCQTNLIAPITVGNDVYTAAGSTISRSIPDGAMAFARARQENKEGYVKAFRALKKNE